MLGGYMGRFLWVDLADGSMREEVPDEALLRGVHIESSSGCDRGQAGDTIIFGPPFIITKTQINDLITVIDETLSVVEKRAGF